jgi:hypothetical protein
MNAEHGKERGNEIVGSAHFSMGRAVFRIMGSSIVILYLVMVSFVTLSRGEPLGSVITSGQVCS